MSKLSNEELVRKATITADALATAGKLNPAQSNRFLDYVIDETDLKGKTRVVKFKNEQMTIEKIGVANRVAMPKAEAKNANMRRGVTTSKITLQPVEIMVPFEIEDLVKDYNIEGDNVEDHIVKMMATRLANNMEELYWDGNTVGPAALESDIMEGGSASLYRKDTYLALMNGWLKAAEAGNTVDALNAGISPNLISRLLSAIPNRFKKDKKKLKAFLSWDHEQAMRENLSGRGTAAGDAALSGDGNIKLFGIELMPISLLDPNPLYVENVAANADGTTPSSLSYNPVTSLVLAKSTMGIPPEAAYQAPGTDATVDLANGQWTRLGGGNIGAAESVKCTYRTGGRILLSSMDNMITAIGMDVRIEKDRNIYSTTWEYAITARIYCTFEETDAVALLTNVAIPS
jgi:hypothetical protein